MKKVILGLGLALAASFSAAASDDAKEKYKNAFALQIEKSMPQILASTGQFGQPGEAKFENKMKEIVLGLTGCHMKSMEYFSKDIQDKTYDVVLNGGSYADAKMSMNSILAASAAGGGESQEKVKEMVINSVEHGKVCMTKILGG